jgi:hypothetical protein
MRRLTMIATVELNDRLVSKAKKLTGIGQQVDESGLAGIYTVCGLLCRNARS